MEPAGPCTVLTAKECRAEADCSYDKSSKACASKSRRDRRAAHGELTKARAHARTVGCAKVCTSWVGKERSILAMVRRQGVHACPCVNTPLTVCAQRWCLPPCGLGNPSLAGAVCVNFFANELCADTLGRRVRRKGHGMTAVCMAVKATTPAPPMEFLNDESAIDEFGLTFVSEEEAD